MKQLASYHERLLNSPHPHPSKIPPSSPTVWLTDISQHAKQGRGLTLTLWQTLEVRQPDTRMVASCTGSFTVDCPWKLIRMKWQSCGGLSDIWGAWVLEWNIYFKWQQMISAFCPDTQASNCRSQHGNMKCKCKGFQMAGHLKTDFCSALNCAGTLDVYAIIIAAALTPVWALVIRWCVRKVHSSFCNGYVPRLCQGWPESAKYIHLVRKNRPCKHKPSSVKFRTLCRMTELQDYTREEEISSSCVASFFFPNVWTFQCVRAAGNAEKTLSLDGCEKKWANGIE